MRRAPTLPDILTRWRLRQDETERKRTDRSFLVPKDEIAGNDYDLSINRYKEVVYDAVEYDPPKVILKRLAKLEEEGFRIRAARFLQLDDAQAGEFYAVHRERPFYDALKRFMTSGPVIPLVLEADNAVPRLRETIGATDPAEAAEGTVRKLYAESKERNAIHASDSDENSAIERSFFFSTQDTIGL